MARPFKLDSSMLQSTPEIRALYPEFSKKLIERQEEITGRMTTERAHLDQQILESPGDVADVSVLDTSADYFLNLANNHQRELVEIRDALDRMHRGAYGICPNCENPIAIERLRKLPIARLCMDCQSARERRNGGGVVRSLKL